MYNMRKNQIIITALVVMIVIVGYINYNDRTNATYNENQEALQVTALGVGADQFEDPENIFGLPSTAETMSNSSENKDEADKKEEGKKEEDKQDEKKDDMKKEDEKKEANNDTENNEKKPEEQEKDKEEDSKATETETDRPGTAVYVDSSAVAANYFAEIKVDREQKRAKSVEHLFSIISNKETPAADKSDAANRMIKLQERIMMEADAEAMLKAKGYGQTYVCVGDEYVDVIVGKENLDDTDVAKILDVVCRKAKVEPSQVNITTGTFSQN